MLRYTIKAEEPAEAVGIRLEIRDEVGNPLAAACLYGLELDRGTTAFTVRYDLSVLAPGKHGSYFTLFTLGEGGAHTVEDWVPGMTFKIVDTLLENETEWNTVAWGPIQLPNAVLTEKGETRHD